MGGNALKSLGIESKRLGKEAFERVGADLVEKLEALWPGCRPTVVPAYETKMDFGDVDVMVLKEKASFGEEFEAWAAEKLGSRGIFRNGDVVSVEYLTEGGESFQADLMATPEACFDFALKYFSYNDLGNLIGRSAHNMGLKFGHDGLWMPCRDGDNLHASVLVTDDFSAALEFLGYSASRRERGFKEVEDIFEYTASGKYFNKEIFALESRSYKARVRDRKRATYIGFLKWCAERDLPAFDWPEDKSVWREKVFEAFPKARKDYAEAQAELALAKREKEAFSGDAAAKATGLSGPELGAAMSRTREAFGTREEFRAWLFAASEDELAEAFRAGAKVAAENGAASRRGRHMWSGK